MRLFGMMKLGMATGLLGALFMASTPTVHAQGGSVRCESVNARFNRCPVRWRDAQLIKQESKGACVRNESWGMDRQGLWVDRGCRGVFAEGRGDYGGGWRPGPGGGRQIQCDSNQKRYVVCRADIGRRGSVRLLNQTSDARCTQDYSWGWNRDGIWVNHGCRGLFLIDRR
jgi:hypothetical protein